MRLYLYLLFLITSLLLVYQNIHDGFHRTKANNPQIHVEPQKTPSCQRKKNKDGGITSQTSNYTTKHNNQNNMILAQK